MSHFIFIWHVHDIKGGADFKVDTTAPMQHPNAPEGCECPYDPESCVVEGVSPW